jgi:RNA polymerase sigma-70 factor (ECF subfamily)
MTGPDAFEVFVREYQDMVYATALRLLRGSADAEDVSQAVFLKAFERFGEIGGSPSAAGWLKTVAINLCLNHLSRYRNRWRLFSELDENEEFDAPDATGSSPDAGVDAAARRRVLAAALRQLPDRQRVPLVLFHFEELSYQDIAAALKVSIGKVKTDIHRGREALKRVLEARDGSA